ncbi:MAG: acetolactate synthase small subunit [Bacteroidales bacterium]|nr:acetolactate synthase small subunit [Bacteroidales bacterium]
MNSNHHKQTYTITAFSENHIGLLNRITIIFTRRQVNIESLTVSASAIEGLHKFTIVVFETEEKVKKVVSQTEKMVEVMKAFYHTDDEIIQQEIALYKVPTEELLDSTNIEQIVRQYNARILEVTKEYTVIEKTGHKEETQRLFDELKPYGVKQFTRSGRIAITKQSQELLTNYLSEMDKREKEIMNNNY